MGIVFFYFYYIVLLYYSGQEDKITPLRIGRADHATPFYLQKMALTYPTSGGCLVGIVRSRTKATELLVMLLYYDMCVCVLLNTYNRHIDLGL
jgi:hypothetical protein